MNQPIFVRNVLSKTECEEWIKFANKRSFSKASSSNSIRTNSRAYTICSDRTQLIFERVKEFLPKTIDQQWCLLRCHTQLALLRYENNQYVGKHRDEHYVMSDSIRSFLTILVYLNDGFEGGETRFEEQKMEYYPEVGSALIFNQDFVHEGRPCSAMKLSVALDVLYQKT